MQIPPQFTCSDRLEWSSFRELAQAHAGNGWPSSPDPKLASEARRLHERWSGMVCVEPCRSSDDFRWGWVEAVGSTCHDSPQFRRVLVKHYFDNRGLTYGSVAEEAAQGFCLYGYITVLVVLAQLEFAQSVARAVRFIFLAFQLLGDFFSFDWMESSGWPVRLIDLNFNLLVSSSHLHIVHDQLEKTLLRQHPGEAGSGALRGLQLWTGTSEHGKPMALPGESRGWAALSVRKSSAAEVVVWQACQHTSVAGEAKTMLERFEDSVGFSIRFIGNSFAMNVCQNYGLCASTELRRSLEPVLFGTARSFAEASADFTAIVRPLTGSVDVFLCTQPPYWCRFMLALGSKPVWMHAGLPLMWSAHEDRAAWLREFAAMLDDPRHVVTASSVFLAHEILWQVGRRPPVLRMLGLHTGAVHYPTRNDSVLVSRFGTSAGLSECVLARYLDANPWVPLRFVQLEAVLSEHHAKTSGAPTDSRRWASGTKEIKTPGMPYNALAEHRAAMLFPYDAVIFLFHEFYSMQVPVFVPRDLWRWMFGPLTLPSMEIQLERNATAEALFREPHQRPRFSPFCAPPREPIELEATAFWASLTDWALLPHVQYFRSAAELLKKLLDGAELRLVSSRMKAFNEEQLVVVTDGWRQVAARLVSVAVER